MALFIGGPWDGRRAEIPDDRKVWMCPGPGSKVVDYERTYFDLVNGTAIFTLRRSGPGMTKVELLAALVDGYHEWGDR